MGAEQLKSGTGKMAKSAANRSQLDLMPLHELVPVPDSRWVPPETLPSLAGANFIGLDTETYDPDLKEKGPGVRRDGYIVGVSLATDTGINMYLPVAHAGGGNMDKELVFRYLRDQLADENQPKVGANLLYDLDYLAQADIPVAGNILDVQNAAPLLDEQARSYSLNSLCQLYDIPTKKSEKLEDWLKGACGYKTNILGQLWQAPASLVGEYAEYDAVAPLLILQKQLKEIEAQGLGQAWQLECDLVPMLLAMRRRGVRVDVNLAEQVVKLMKGEILALRKEIQRQTGVMIDLWAAGSIAKALSKAGITVPRTAKGNISITKPWLEAHPHPLCQLIKSARQLDKLGGVFLQSYIVEQNVNGRLHAQFHQLRRADDDTGLFAGTISYRMSSDSPNLQNIPGRGAFSLYTDAAKAWIAKHHPHALVKDGVKVKKLMRSVFLPEEGEIFFASDYSQIEYRELVHYGRGPGAKAARERYNREPDTDFHAITIELTGLERDFAKTASFTKIYGGGVEKFAATIKQPVEVAEAIFQKLDEKLPFLKETMRQVSLMADKRGYILLHMGARARFTHWEPRYWDSDEPKPAPVREYGRAVKEWGKVKRAHTFKALNRLLQGGAAYVLKAAMRDVWQSGVTDVLGVPTMTVHDELTGSRPLTPAGEEARFELMRLMENSVAHNIPIRVECDEGPNWGNLDTKYTLDNAA